jgi:hypothetical protein
MTGPLVEEVLRGTYHLAGADATRLRRLTRAAGLEAENVLSRLAIARSAAHRGAPDPVADAPASTSGRAKEIKGPILLGRPPQAALLVALALRSPAATGDIKHDLMWHWARGLRLLERDAGGTDVLTHLARSVAGGGDPGPARGSTNAPCRNSLRDQLADAVGRRYPRWQLEARRLTSLAARLDPARLDETVDRMARDAEALEPGTQMRESLALRVMQERWGLNRLGLDAADREHLAAVVDGQQVQRDGRAAFLAALGLVTSRGEVKLTARGRALGKDALQP